jgi:hypothetical protein
MANLTLINVNTGGNDGNTITFRFVAMHCDLLGVMTGTTFSIVAKVGYSNQGIVWIGQLNLTTLLTNPVRFEPNRTLDLVVWIPMYSSSTFYEQL